MKVELSLYALKLKNVAGFGRGKSDPFAVVRLLQEGQLPRTLGQTEVIENSLSPNWVKVFVFDYELGTPCKVVVTVYDQQDNNAASSSRGMGSATFDVGETLGARGSTKAKNMKGQGTLYATVRKSTGSGEFRFQFRGENLTNREGWFRLSDPFFELCRRVEIRGNLVWDVVYRSKNIHDDLNPKWEPDSVPLSQLCGGDVHLPIRIEVFDHERSGKHVLIGFSETTVATLVERAKPENKSKCMKLMQSNKEEGDLFVEKAEVAVPEGSDRSSFPFASVMDEEKPDFVEYINGGCGMRVVVGIDYTASNGDPRTAESLHYLENNGNGVPNDYQTALKSIVGILAKYDSDMRFPVFGFGAKFDGVVHNSFQVGLSAEVNGVDGVLSAYKSAFSTGMVMSSQPTDYTEIMRISAKHAHKELDKALQGGGQAYTVLLIVTDGVGVDTTAAIEVLKEIADAPLSIIIVGVGKGTFTEMEHLDHARNDVGRDMVKFVHFEKYRDNVYALTDATLSELPEQLVDYFQSRGMDPLPPVEVKAEDLEAELEDGDIDLGDSYDADEVRVTHGGVNEFEAFVP